MPERSWLEKMIASLRERAKTLAELVDSAHYFLSDEIVFDPKTAKRFLTPEIAAPLRLLIDRVEQLATFDEAAVEGAFAEVLSQYHLQMGALAQPVRVALTGGTVSPGIHQVIALLGRERSVQRLRSALTYIDQLDSIA